jgi:hypothetical protein
VRGAESGTETGREVGIAVAVGALVLAAVATGAAVGGAGESHGPEGSNFTYTPLSVEDRQPGATGTRVGQIGQAAAGVETDFETLLRLRAVWRAGSWEGCGPGSAEVFGIDRGKDNEPYEVDESLYSSVKSFTATEDVFESTFYDEDDFGESVHLNSGDRIFSVIECPDNPARAGWHQIEESSVTGRTADGEVVTYADPSHYFWICDCENEADAREELGPPPAEPAETPVRTATADDGPGPDAAGGPTTTETRTSDVAGGEETPADSTDVATATRTAASATPTPAAATRTPTADTGEWDDYQVRTPTVKSGSGFAPIAALSALLVATGLTRWWRRA